MELAIHVEVDVLFLVLLGVIAWQVRHSVSQEMNRILFHYVVAGTMFILALDVAWILLEGRIFPGSIFLNNIINAIYLSAAVVMACIWYLYVLDCLKHKITNKLVLIVMIPGLIFTILNLLSIKTGWIYYISEDNYYIRGPLFPLQVFISYFSLFFSMLHLIVAYFSPKTRVPKSTVRKLLSFYIVPTLGMIATMSRSGMPGLWNCAAVSVILIYISDQDDAILRDSLTGLNNRKTLETTYSAYIRQVSENKKLYLLMMDLNNFKDINDTYGHTVGDQALVEAAQLIKYSVSGIKGIVVRYGGDEFLFMGFFDDEKHVMAYENKLKSDFERWNIENDNPYTLKVAVGYSCYEDGKSLEQFVAEADEELYNEKKALNCGR